MKIAIITDQHFGARKNSKLFHDYFLKFYNDIFFPTLEREGITTVIDMGDTFDIRKSIDFSVLILVHCSGQRIIILISWRVWELLFIVL